MTKRQGLAELFTRMADQERTRLGADLHDGLCQELTGLAFMLKGLATRAHRESSAFAPEIAEISNLATSTITSARDIAHGMLPVELQYGDFRAALQALSRSTLRAFKMPVTVRLGGDPGKYPMGRVAEHLYRIAQESISNAIKHGHANRITVSMMATHKGLTFNISDDGKGRQQVPEIGRRQRLFERIWRECL